MCNIFKNYFVNVAKDIGNDATQYDQDFLNHLSILKKIKMPLKNLQMKFFLLNQQRKLMCINLQFRPKKSTVADNISAKVLKACVSSVSGTISNLINTTYKSCKFPSGLK